MNKQCLYLLSLCTVATMAFAGCSPSNETSCEVVSDCGPSSEWKCDLDTSKCVRLFPEHCADKTTNEGETDVDCGGTCVSESTTPAKYKCADEKICKENSDCISDNCVNNKCTPKACSEDNDCSSGKTCDTSTKVCISCNDKVKNGSESDVDCGGTCAKQCTAGMACNQASDCELGVCTNGKCEDVKVDTASPDDLLINEFMANTQGKENFELNGSKQCKFIEIVNVTDHALDLTGCRAVITRTDVDKKSESALTGKLAAGNAIVVHDCGDEMKLPAGIISVEIASPSNITMEGEFKGQIMCGDKQGTIVDLQSVKNKNKGTSLNRETDLDPKTDMVLHDTAKDKNGAEVTLKATPGYCANGGSFSNGCISPCSDKTMNGNESDVDCGGICAKCDNDKKCNSNDDCASGYCTNNKVCAKPECTNHNECTNGKVCKDYECVEGKINDTLKKLVINEIFDNGARSPSFEFGGYTLPAYEFVEIANISDEEVTLDGIDLLLTSTDKNGKVTELVIPLTGKLARHQLAIVNKAEDRSGEDSVCVIPEGAGISVVSPTDSFITGTRTYDLALRMGDDVDTQITGLAINSVVTSSYVRVPEFSHAGVMQKTTDLGYTGKWYASPAYCSNGGTFINDCKDGTVTPTPTDDSCANKVKDGDETDVDCGGKCGKCADDKACKVASDCESGSCEDNVCKGKTDPVDPPSNPNAATANDLLINEFMAAEDTTQSSKSFFTYNDNAKECKFVEIVNVSGKEIVLDGCSIEVVRTDTEGKSSSTKLSGTFNANGALVAHNCSELKLPDGVLSFKLASTTNITQGGTYKISTKCNDVEGTVIPVEKALKGTSMNLPTDFDKSATSMIKHTDVAGSNGVVASPGYCVNGGLLTDGCKTSDTPVVPTGDVIDTYCKFLFDCGWNEEEGSHDTIEDCINDLNKFNAEHAKCSDQNKAFLSCVPKNTCQQWDAIKDEEEACKGDQTCIDNLYKTKGCDNEENAFKACTSTNYPN